MRIVEEMRNFYTEKVKTQHIYFAVLSMKRTFMQTLGLIDFSGSQENKLGWMDGLMDRFWISIHG